MPPALICPARQTLWEEACSFLEVSVQRPGAALTGKAWAGVYHYGRGRQHAFLCPRHAGQTLPKPRALKPEAGRLPKGDGVGAGAGPGALPPNRGHAPLAKPAALCHSGKRLTSLDLQLLICVISTLDSRSVPLSQLKASASLTTHVTATRLHGDQDPSQQSRLGDWLLISDLTVL